MNTLMENTAAISILGATLVGLMVLVAGRLGDRRYLIAGAVIGTLTLVLAFITFVVKTDREKLASTMHQIAEALRQNDHETVLSYMHPDAAPAIRRVKDELNRFKFEEAKITSIQSIVVTETRPRSATTEFIGRVRVVADNSNFGMRGTGIRRLKVYWMLQGDRWMVKDYEHSDAQEAFTNRR